MASRQLFDAVPFYAGLTLDLIGGRGVRWPATEAAAAVAPGAWEPVGLSVPPAAGGAEDGALRLGTWKSLWTAPEVDLSPALQFMRPRQVVELSPPTRSASASATATRSRSAATATASRPPRGCAPRCPAARCS